MTVPLLALVLAGAAVLGLVAVVDQLYARDRQAKQLRTRAAAIAVAYGRRPGVVAAGPSRKRRSTSSRGSLQGMLGVLKIQTARADLYPAPWWTMLVGIAIIALLAGILGSRIIGPMGWLAAPLLLVLLSRTLFGSFVKRRQKRLYEQIPDALSMVVRAVRAGLPVTEALRSVGRDAPAPTASEFARLGHDLGVGVSLQDSLLALADRTGLQEYKFFAVALALQGQTGGNLTETLENLADVVRKRVALRARALALAAEAKMTANVLIALPFVTGGALAFIAPDYVSVLVTNAQGRLMLLAALALLGAGIFTMRTMIHRSLS
jgi:tight adherence protein B